MLRYKNKFAKCRKNQRGHCLNLCLQELAKYFQDPVLSKEKEIRHAFAGLLAEILLPVAAVVKNEVNIPAVKNLVKTYFEGTRQAAEKKKHMVAMFPLVTCLLAIRDHQFYAFFVNPGIYMSSHVLSSIGSYNNNNNLFHQEQIHSNTVILNNFTKLTRLPKRLPTAIRTP